MPLGVLFVREDERDSHGGYEGQLLRARWPANTECPAQVLTNVQIVGLDLLDIMRDDLALMQKCCNIGMKDLNDVLRDQFQGQRVACIQGN